MDYETEAVKLWRAGLTIEQVTDVIYQRSKNNIRKGTTIKRSDISRDVNQDIYDYYMTNNVLSASN